MKWSGEAPKVGDRVAHGSHIFTVSKVLLAGCEIGQVPAVYCERGGLDPSGRVVPIAIMVIGDSNYEIEYPLYYFLESARRL